MQRSTFVQFVHVRVSKGRVDVGRVHTTGNLQSGSIEIGLVVTILHATVGRLVRFC